MNFIKLTNKSPVDDRDWIFESVTSNLIIPDELDYTNEIPIPRDQGFQGSCAAFSASTMKEWQEMKDIGFKEHMSPQFIYNHRINKDSDGMFCRDVMNILRNIGICFESDYSYGTLEMPTEDILNKAKHFIIKGYAFINSINGLKKALLLNGPCLIAFPCYHEGSNMWKPLNNQKIPEEDVYGHAMTVIGYNKKGFIIRNSWGKDWNDNGNCLYLYEDWGSHWEIWTTIDEETTNIFKENKDIDEEINKPDPDIDNKDLYIDNKDPYIDNKDPDIDNKEQDIDNKEQDTEEPYVPPPPDYPPPPESFDEFKCNCCLIS